jgi:hypothetical protein
MARWIEEEELPQAQVEEGETLVEPDQVEESLQPEEVSKPEEPQETAPEQPEEDELPEKYRGKSAAEIAKMHMEAEKAMGRQGNEIGELRKVFDDFVKSSAQAQTKPEPEEVDEKDYFVDPRGAVNRQIENHPALQQAQAVAVEMRKAQGVAELTSRHPDVKEVLGSSDFQEWVNGSPVRQRLYREADQQMDVAAADELLSTFKQLKRTAASSEEVSKVARKSAVKNASTGSSRTNPDGARRGRIYRRSDIRQLMRNDPKRYEELQPEIMLAYAEGRVRG